MNIYLVGGAVRDRLLGKPVHERDYVVVGATPQQMLALGYRQVGKDFPVFLHPQTQAEYALARTERKTGQGYTGFAIAADPSVTLEQDLMRRDLTINAIAQSDSGELIDPYHGRADLQQRVLRHVSPAFVEDPLRVLRVARFAARFAADGFTVAPETMELMRTIADQGELATLSAERVWRETEKALSSATPAVFWQVLSDAHALTPWFSELQPASIIKLTRHYLSQLDTPDPLIAFCLSLYPLNPERAQQLCERLKVPNSYRQLALKLCRAQLSASSTWNADAAFAYMGQFDLWRQPEQLTNLLKVWQYVGIKEPVLAAFQRSFEATQELSAAAVIEAAKAEGQALQGPQIGAALQSARHAKVINEWQLASG